MKISSLDLTPELGPKQKKITIGYRTLRRSVTLGWFVTHY